MNKGQELASSFSPPEGLVIEHAFRFGFPASNNVVEYEAMILGLTTAKQLGACYLQALSDSHLVAR